MESAESLENSIELYKTQLSQINEAIEASSSDSEKNNLISLQENINELLHLTQESLKSLNDAKIEKDVGEKADDDPFAKEYELFKAELGDLMKEDSSKDEGNGETISDVKTVSESKNKSNEDTVCIQDELETLLGSKCQAPFYNKYYSKSYHNALICGVETSDSETGLDAIKVRVLFINPIERDMVTCPYFLDDKCNYGEEKCNFSHGYSVPFQDLREYIEPDFSELKKGRAVLAKVSGSRVWKSTVIEELVSDEEVVVRHEGTSVHVPIQDIFPLLNTGDGSDLSSESELEDDIEEARGGLSSQQEAIVEMTLSRDQPLAEKPLGHWEQFTKGIGSKLMAKMGYVVGSGLGRNGEGRLTPVEATVLPAGKSLDHCMELKEAAGGSKDLFSAEKIQKKLSLQALRRSKRAYFREKYKEKHNVFNFINTNLNSAPPSTSKNKVKEALALNERLSKTSGRALNVERFKIAEDIRESQKRIYVLSESLTRQESGSIPHKNIQGRLEAERNKLASLRNMDHKVEREQSLRQTKRKMTVF